MWAAATWLCVGIYQHLWQRYSGVTGAGQGQYHTRIRVRLKASPKRFCESVVICFDGTYAKRSDDASTKVGGKFGVCHTNFLLAPIKEVPAKASPRRGQQFDNKDQLKENIMLQLWKDGALHTRLLATTTWPYKVPTNEESEAKSCTC